jgi:hypothetical protein
MGDKSIVEVSKDGGERTGGDGGRRLSLREVGDGLGCVDEKKNE